jgi:hypothetical protein
MHYTSLGCTSKIGTDIYQNEELKTVEGQTQNSEQTCSPTLIGRNQQTMSQGRQPQCEGIR